jgi:hypothetical protein
VKRWLACEASFSSNQQIRIVYNFKQPTALITVVAVVVFEDQEKAAPLLPSCTVTSAAT